MQSATSPKSTRIVEVATAQKLHSDFRAQTPIEVPVEECTGARMLPAERVTRSVGQLYRGMSTSEVDGAALRIRKVSCGKLYEELAYLRKENTVLHRTCTELEQRANEEFSQQLADELAQLRQDNQALQIKNLELQSKLSELDATETHDILLGTTEMKLEELRQKQEAEVERNKDQIGVLLHQNEKLKSEVDDLRRERREQGRLSIEQANPHIQALKQQNELLKEEVEDLKRTLQEGRSSFTNTEELRLQLQDVLRQNSEMASELEEFRGCHAKDVAYLRSENAELQRKCAELGSRLEGETTSHWKTEELEQREWTLVQENQHLSSEARRLEAELESANIRCQRLETANREPVELVEHCIQESSPCSQNRLKAVMTDRSATLEQLREAIGAAEALLGEARREFAAKQLREKRHAFEQLHLAIDNGDEQCLVEAIAIARRAEVDAEDIVKGEAKLALLRSLSDDQRAAKALEKRSTECKKQAFFYVKKDDAAALQELLESLDENLRWQEWRDYMGRTLWRFAQELRASRSQDYLAPLLGLQFPKDQLSAEAAHQRAVLAQRLAEPAAVETVQERVEPAEQAEPAAEEGAPAEAESSIDSLPALSEAEEAAIKQKAFRSVVQDNTCALLEVLQRLHVDVWSKWQNKAGKDLLTLSQERGSSGAYSVLAKALGLVQEQKREAFDEREAVWIFVQGEVQPRRATVMEDTPEEADEVLVEYWDGDEPAGRVDRCLVRKMWS